MILKQDLLDIREQIQEDLDSILDGYEEAIKNHKRTELLTKMDQTVIDRFEILFSKLDS